MVSIKWRREVLEAQMVSQTRYDRKYYAGDEGQAHIE
jgi:hypothetical protein